MTKRVSVPRRKAPPKPDPTVFLHIVAVDKQISIHASEKKRLSVAIAEAFRFFKKTIPKNCVVRDNDGDKISSEKTPKELALEENQVIYVRDPKTDRDVQKALAESIRSTRTRRR